MRKIYSPSEKYVSPGPEKPHHLVDLLRLDMFPSGDPTQHPGGKSRSPVMATPQISRLKKLGVRFENKDEPGLKVSFKKGTMSINCHRINRNMDVYLRNLIAFEQRYLPAGKKASSYVVLMNYLIRSSEDVEVLSSIKKPILINNLTSEEEVVHLFKTLCRGIDVFDGGEIYEDLSKYSSSKCRKWIGELWETYFKSPWSLIAALSALFLLMLSAVQAFYNVVSFYKRKR